MTYFVSYIKTTGKILSYGVTPDTDISYMSSIDIGHLAVPDNSDYTKTHYVNTGVLTSKGISPVYLEGNTLFDIPVNSEVGINNKTIAIAGVYTLEIPGNIIYEITVNSPPYMLVTFFIDNR